VLPPAPLRSSFLSAFAEFHRFQPGTNLRAWLRQILRNTFNSGYRAKQRGLRLIGTRGHQRLGSVLGREEQVR
jgi:DNA-directed RNA polymerase specialized sigma24 family protein